MRIILSLLLMACMALPSRSQSQNLAAAYQATGYFFHPTAARYMNATKTITRISENRYQMTIADLGASNYLFQFDVDANNNLVNWAAAGNTPLAPSSGFMSSDNPGGFSFYTGSSIGFMHSTYNNRYDPATKTFYMHYGFQGGSTGESQYQRQIYEKLVIIPQPKINFFSPSSGTFGTVVTVTGTEFTGAVPFLNNYYLLDSFKVISDTEMKIWIGNPSNAAVTRIYAGADSSASFFTFTPTAVSNTSWEYLGTAGFGAVANGLVSMALTTNNIPYVAFADAESHLSVMRYASGSWEQVGGTVYSGKTSCVNIKMGNDNLPVLAFVDSSNGNNITVMRYNGSAWVTLGAAGFAPFSLYQSVSLSIDGNNQPYVISSVLSTYHNVSVYTFNGGAWVNLGVVVSGVGNYASLDIDKGTNTPYVVYSGASYQATVKKYAAGSWSVVGNADFTDALRGIYYPTIKIDKLGNPVVVMQFDDYHERLNVYKLVAGTWTTVGSPRFSRSHSFNPSIAFDKNNTPFVAYTDATYNNNGSVMGLSATSGWQLVGDRGFEPGINGPDALQIDSDNVPLVAFADRNNGNRVSVMRKKSLDLAGAYQASGYFFHPTASRNMNATKTITRISENKYQVVFADLSSFSFSFQFDVDANNNLVNWTATGNTPAAPSSGFMTSDNPGGFSFYPGASNGFVHGNYNNRYDPATKTFYMHYGYQSGATGESQYQRQIYEKYVYIPQTKITSFTPSSGSFGTVVTVTGSDLTGVVPSMNRYYLVDSFQVVSNTELKIWIGNPSGASVSRIYAGGDSSASFFTYTPTAVSNTSWQYLGQAGFGSLAKGLVNMALTANNLPYVAFSDADNRVSVMRYAAGAWEQVGGTVSSSKTSAVNIKMGIDNLPVVAFVDSSYGNYITVKRYNGSVWETVGTPGFAPFSLDGSVATSIDVNNNELVMNGLVRESVPLSIDGNNNPHVISSVFSTNHNVSVYKFNGSSWVDMGVVVNGAANYASLDIDKSTNTPYVAYSGASYQATVKKYTAGNWSVVGNADFTDALRGIYYPTISIDKQGNPTVVLQFDDYHERLSAYRLVGGVWTTLSSPRFSHSHSYNPSIAFDKNNTPFVAFTDGSYNNNASVMSFTGANGWQFVGDRGFEPGINGMNAFQIDSNNVPLVAFADRNNGYRVSVMRKITSVSSSFIVSGCNQVLLPWGEAVSVSGSYSHVYPSVNGYDSLVTAAVTMSFSNTGDTTAIACGSFKWYGITYTSSANPTHVFTNVGGCDSVVTLHLTINPLPSAPLVSGLTSFCSGGSVSLTASNIPNRLHITYPIDTTLKIGTSSFGPAATSSNLNGKFKILLNNGDYYGCTSYPANAFAGQIALILRGNCIFTTKAYNAQLGGASAAIFVNNVAGAGAINISGTEPLITIPSITVSLEDGLYLQNLLQNNSHVSGNYEGDGMVTYLWSNGATGSSISVSSGGSYTATATNSYGCASTSIAVSIKANYPNTGDTTATACESFTWYGTIYTATANPTHVFTNVGGCDSVVTLHLTINAKPVAPTANITQPTCNTGGTITVTNGLSGSSYSTDGANYFTSAIFTEMAPGNYNLTAKSESGCISLATPVLVTEPTGMPAAATLSVTNPTCASAYGTIRVTSSVFFNSFSLDRTNFSNTTGVFSGLLAGTYNVWVKNAAGCISAPSTIVVNAQPATPSAPVVTITHPTCTVSTGTIVINSNLGDNLYYSTNNFTYLNITGVFTGMVSGSYSVTAKNAAGCISPVTPVVINPRQTIPTTPSATVIQPNCNLSTGTVTVSSPSLAYTYSISRGGVLVAANGTGLFSGLTSGTYSLVAISTGGCTSTAKSVVVNAQPATPPAPTLSVTQPATTVTTGTIKVTSTVMGNSFSINGSGFTNLTGVFSGLSSGLYSISAKNSSGCISQASSASIGSTLSRGMQMPPSLETNPLSGAVLPIPVPSVLEKAIASAEASLVSDQFEVSAYPNPTSSDFMLTVNSTATETIKVSVYDVFGRVVKYFSFSSKPFITMGQDLKAGVYMIEVRQGKNVRIFKIVKL